MNCRFLLSVLLCILSVSPFIVSAQSVTTADSLVLVDLYNKTNGPAWTNDSNWLSAAPVDTWIGVTARGGNITGINLADDSLQGPIPASLASLTQLQNLDLSGNSLTDTLPAFLGNLVNLNSLLMDGNRFTGAIPVTFGKLTQLTILALQNNRLTGSIPASLNNLTALITLRLDDNRLSGNIPPSLSRLANLNSLWLDGNQLTGSIPVSLGSLSNLTTLRLDANRLTGSIPANFGDLSNLVTLRLDGNQLSGGIPASLGKLYKLNDLYLNKNNLTGNIPDSLGELHVLNSLSLSRNQLSGHIPASLCKLVNLSQMWLYSNLLTGQIPEGIGDLKKLVGIYLNDNQLDGRIPSSLTTLTRLKYIDISRNKFTFAGLEKMVAAHPDTNFTYAPQANIYISRAGNKLLVDAGGSVENNMYTWFKNGTLFASKKADSTYDLIASAVYYVAVTNTAVPQLTLYSDTLSGFTLPLNLLSFTGVAEKNTVALQWQTVNEINTDKFTIQRSSDGLAFAGIGELKAIDNPSMHNYKYTDANALAGANYYRLKMIDKDGYFTYSRIIQVKMNDLNLAMTVYPNPVQNVATLMFSTAFAGKYTVAITDVNGKLLKQVNGTSVIGNNKLQLDIHGYPGGTYLIAVKDEKGNSKVLKLVK